MKPINLDSLRVVARKHREWEAPYKEAGDPRGLAIGAVGLLIEDAISELEQLRSVLDATHKLVTEGALVGFIPTEGTWAERLFKNQGAIHDALNRK